MVKGSKFRIREQNGVKKALFELNKQKNSIE